MSTSCDHDCSSCASACDDRTEEQTSFIKPSHELSDIKKVIGVVSGSIGERLYEAKIYLQTADLLAWTVVIVALSAGFEWLALRLLRHGFRMVGGVGRL